MSSLGVRKRSRSPLLVTLKKRRKRALCDYRGLLFILAKLKISSVELPCSNLL